MSNDSFVEELLSTLIARPELFWNVPSADTVEKMILNIYNAVANISKDIPDLEPIVGVCDSHNQQILDVLCRLDYEGKAGKYTLDDEAREYKIKLNNMPLNDEDTELLERTIYQDIWHSKIYSAFETETRGLVESILDKHGHEYYKPSGITDKRVRVNSSRSGTIWSEIGFSGREIEIGGEAFVRKSHEQREEV